MYEYLLTSTEESAFWDESLQAPADAGVLPYSWRGGDEPYGGGLDLTILRTCKKVQAEGHQFLGERNILRLSMSPGQPTSFRPDSSWFSGTVLRMLPWITRLHVFIYFNNDTECLSVPDVDWKSILKNMNRLKEVQIAVAWSDVDAQMSAQVGEQFVKDKYTEALECSATFAGIMVNAIINISKSVELRRGPWKSMTDIPNQMGARTWQFDIADEFKSLLHPSFLESVAGRFEAICGLACKEMGRDKHETDNGLDDAMDEDIEH